MYKKFGLVLVLAMFAGVLSAQDTSNVPFRFESFGIDVRQSQNVGNGLNLDMMQGVGNRDRHGGYSSVLVPVDVTSEGETFNHFTSRERWQTFWWNFIIPGSGSFFIMRDIQGTIINLICGVAARAMWISSGGGDNQTLLFVGIGVEVAWIVYNSLRSAFFMRNAPEPRGAVGNGNIGFIPGERGIEAVSFTYTLRF